MGVPAENPASYAKTVITHFYALPKPVSEKSPDRVKIFRTKGTTPVNPLFLRERSKGPDRSLGTLTR